jgi:hypothetical protein
MKENRKMRYFLVAGILLLELSLLTCAGVAPGVYKFQNKEVFEASFDEIWTAIIETFAQQNIPISNMEKVSGFITTQEIRFPAEYADCGATPIGIKLTSAGLLGSFNVFVKEVSPGTYSIAVNSHYRVITDNPFYQGCVSTGKLETKLIADIRTKLKK